MANLLFPTTPQRLKQIYCAPTPMGAQDGSTQANAMGLEEAIARLTSDRLLHKTLGNSVSSLFLVPGNYALTAPLSIFDYRPTNQILRIEGLGAIPNDVTIRGSGSAAFRIFRSVVSFKNLSIGNDGADAIAAWQDSILFLEGVDFLDTLYDCLFLNERTHLNCTGTLGFSEAMNPDTLMRMSEFSTCYSDATWDFQGNAVDFSQAVLLMNPGASFLADSLPLLNSGAVVGRKFLINGDGRISINGRSREQLNLELPGDSAGEFSPNGDERVQPQVFFSSNNAEAGQEKTYRKTPAFFLAANKAVYFSIAESGLSPISLIGHLGIQARDGGSGNYLSVTTNISGILQGTALPITNQWQLQYNYNLSQSGPPFDTFNLQWYSSGTLSDTNGTVGRFSLSRQGDFVYINNRNTYGAFITFDWLITYRQL